jgi:hypothetical protein
MTVNVALNHDALTNLLADLAHDAELLEATLKALNRIVDLLKVSGELVRVETNATLGASEITVSLYPTDRFHELVTALRARYRDLASVQESGH